MTRKLLLLNSLVLMLLGVPVVQQAAIQGTDANNGIQIDFEGNQAFTADQLRTAMRLAGEVGQPGNGPTFAEELEKGLERMRQFLIAQSYLSPTIGKPQVEEVGSGLTVRVTLQEGPLYRLGQVDVTGATVFSKEQIIQILEMREGDPFRGEVVHTWFEKLKDAYANLGYINWTPVPRQGLRLASRESPEGAVDLTVDMEEGSRFSIRKIEFTGNTLAGEPLLRGQLQIREGDLFIPTLLETSSERINQLVRKDETR